MASGGPSTEELDPIGSDEAGLDGAGASATTDELDSELPPAPSMDGLLLALTVEDPLVPAEPELSLLDAEAGSSDPPELLQPKGINAAQQISMAGREIQKLEDEVLFMKGVR